MAAERLLERLGHWGNSDVRMVARAQRQEILLRSVQRHLSLILSTRKGSAEIDGNLGLPNNLELLSLGNSLPYAQEIVEQIRRYEPRFFNPQVEVIGLDRGKMQLNCALSGQLGDDLQPISFRVSIQADGGNVLVEL